MVITNETLVHRGGHIGTVDSINDDARSAANLLDGGTCDDDHDAASSDAGDGGYGAAALT